MTDKHASRGKPTGAGAEAAEGIHAADETNRQADGDPSEKEQVARRGSEPTTSHSTEHKSSYGGGGPNGGVK